MSKLFNWMVDQDVLDASPAVRVTVPAEEHERQRVLSAAEIRALWHACDAVDADGGRLVTPLMASVFRLRLLTAQRGGEVAAMCWDEIDGEWWTIPPERSKNGPAHRVYLSAPARAILDDVAASRRDRVEWVFASPRTPARRVSLLEALPSDPAHALPLEALLIRVPTVLTTARKALRTFMARGLVGALGTGVRGDPLRYYRATGPLSIPERPPETRTSDRAPVPHISHYQKAWDRLCEAAKLTDAVSHDLRRTAALGMASLGVPRRGPPGAAQPALHPGPAAREALHLDELLGEVGVVEAHVAATAQGEPRRAQGVGLTVGVGPAACAMRHGRAPLGGDPAA